LEKKTELGVKLLQL